MIEEERICRICGKPYEYEFERTITFMKDGIGHEYVACEKCFDKYKKYIEGKVKYRRESKV